MTTGRSGEKQRLSRERVLDAAERLLRLDSGATFSMRDLAAEAGVSFATPFNQFGSKAAIMQALSARRIEEMTVRLQRTAPGGDIADRVRVAASIAAGVLLEQPEANRTLIGSLGAPTDQPGTVSARSGALWSLALAGFPGIDPALRTVAETVLPGQVALVFRGCLSFWVAGEIADDALQERAASAAIVAVAAFLPEPRREMLLARIA